MRQEILLGAGFALAAGLQPGPLQAFLVSRVVTTGWRRTLPAAFAPLLSDLPVALLVVLVLGRLPLLAQQGLRAAGGVLLLWLAWGAAARWRRPPEEPATAEGAAPRTFVQAVLINLVNPNVYLGWALVLGPAALRAWRRSGAHAAGFVVAFYTVMVVTTVVFVVVVGAAGALGPRVRRGLLAVSGAALAVLGGWQLAVGAAGLVRP